MLSGCTIAPPPREPDEISRIGTVGVVSAFADKLRVYEAGILVFGNREFEHAIPDWRLDEEAVLIARRSLNRSGKHKVVPVSLTEAQRAEIDAAHQPATMLDSGTDFKRIGEALIEARLQTAADAFVVLGKHRSVGPSMRPPLMQGAGIVAGARRRALPLPGETELRDVDGPYGDRVLAPFAFYRVSVIRASDLSPIASTIAQMPLEDGVLSWPWKRIHSSIYKEEFARYTDEDKRVLREVIVNVLEASLPWTLKELGFRIQ